MGYTTEFSGKFALSRTLTETEANELFTLSRTRHGGDCRHFRGFPGFWCQWVPTSDRTGLEWDGGEKFYNYTEWLRFVARILARWGVYLSGSVEYTGEDTEDTGTITISTDGITNTGTGAGDCRWSNIIDDTARADELAEERAQQGRWL